MQRLVSFLFFVGFVAIVALIAYAVNLKFEYNASPVELYNREIADWTFGMLLTSMIGVSFSVVGLYWVRGTLLATRGTAEAAREANEITRASLQTSERAWIVSKIKPVGPISVDSDGHWLMPAHIVNSNVGKTPALNVSSNLLVTDSSGIPAAVEKLKQEALSNNKGSGILIAPQDGFERRWFIGSSSIEGDNDNHEGIPEFIVGCVTYSTIFDEKIHYTIFVYNVSRNTGSTSGFVDPELYDGMPPEEIYLWPWSGSHAT